MKSLALMMATLALGLTLATSDAEAAKRLGGGSSAGMQRQAVMPQKSTAAPGPTTPAPNQATAPAHNPAAAAPATAAQPKRSWMGPLAGLAAGIGLAALASHFGFGEELASMLMIGLLIMGVMMVVGYFMRRKAGAQSQPAMAGAMAGQGGSYGNAYNAEREQAPYQAFQAAPAATGSSAGQVPADFDKDGFVRQAKVNFIRLQAANDARNLDDIREFTTPEMFGEIKLAMAERGSETQETDVVSLNGEVIDVSEEDKRYVISVRFNGLIREERNAQPEPFDELWHLVKPKDGSRGWLLAGIQQIQ